MRLFTFIRKSRVPIEQGTGQFVGLMRKDSMNAERRYMFEVRIVNLRRHDENVTRSNLQRQMFTFQVLWKT